MSNNWNPWVLLFALASLIAAFSQMLLKKSASEPHENILREYLNIKVITGYGMMFASMLVCVFAYSHQVSMQSGAVMDSIGNLWIMILSFLIFREPITKKKILGNLMIISGVIVFNMFS